MTPVAPLGPLQDNPYMNAVVYVGLGFICVLFVAGAISLLRNWP